ncbi:uncharacterized protein LOC123879118 [Maniola jurtina]|uniref:uncharacterized protein LOC123879118 n=1 Tax=Maniola jurtina TaxID=191418 RepID=UPI001E68DB85|nr:uncharacterized protein LOC123879118 [Maniola jurtina]
MGRTSVLIFWIASLTVISLSEAGIPLNLRCSSRPTLSTISRSAAAPFLSAEPCLSFVPGFVLPEPIADLDVDETPESPETAFKTIVILHKAHRNDDNSINIVITRDGKQPTDEQSNECSENNYSDDGNMTDETLMNQDEILDSTNNDEPVPIGASTEELPVQDDKMNLVEKDTPIDENACDTCI